jgi:peptidoglycan-N-acetylglucosamine deacetylase
VTWDTVAEDWRAHDAQWMAERLQRQIKPGSVVVLHDAICRSIQDNPQYDRQPMLSAVSMILERLEGKYRFMTIPELFRHGRPQGENWYRKAPPNLLDRLSEHPVVAGRLAGRNESATC